MWPHVPTGLLSSHTGAPAGFKALLSPNDNECTVSAQCAGRLTVNLFYSDSGYSLFLLRSPCKNNHQESQFSWFILLSVRVCEPPWHNNVFLDPVVQNKGMLCKSKTNTLAHSEAQCWTAVLFFSISFVKALRKSVYTFPSFVKKISGSMKGKKSINGQFPTGSLIKH